ncbi:unnamed protein product [Schistosoma intercalatum]|nr:unnamed protein product [Schistosoma intercalatum]
MGNAPTMYAYFVACERIPLDKNNASTCTKQILRLLTPYVGNVSSEIALIEFKTLSSGCGEFRRLVGEISISISLPGEFIMTKTKNGVVPINNNKKLCRYI